MNLLKKLLGIPEDIEVKPQKLEPEKTTGDLEYELAKRKAREQRERMQSQETSPNEPPDSFSGQ